MKCEEFEQEWQELDDPSLFSPAMEEHHQTCSSCAAKVRDINLIRWQARQMVETVEPPERVWLNLRRRLNQEGLVREPGAWLALRRLFAFEWLPPLPMSLAYAAVFFLALSGALSLRNLLTPVSTPPPLPSTAMVQNTPKAEAPSSVRSAERDEAVRKVIEKAPPDTRTVYLTRWQQLNSSIDELQGFVAAHPEDPLARMQLYTVYEQQERLWESLMRWEEF